jgi:hypothetical protein
MDTMRGWWSQATRSMLFCLMLIKSSPKFKSQQRIVCYGHDLSKSDDDFKFSNTVQ